MSIAAYAKTHLASETPNQSEYRLFAEITGELETANQETATHQQRINALFRNAQLWLTLEADLVSDGNKLDLELKAGLISLAIWVNKFTPNAMKTKISLEPLVSNNRQIMDGLRISAMNSRKLAVRSERIDYAELRA